MTSGRSRWPRSMSPRSVSHLAMAPSEAGDPSSVTEPMRRRTSETASVPARTRCMRTDSTWRECWVIHCETSSWRASSSANSRAASTRSGRAASDAGSRASAISSRNRRARCSTALLAVPTFSAAACIEGCARSDGSAAASRPSASCRLPAPNADSIDCTRSRIRCSSALERTKNHAAALTATSSTATPANAMSRRTRTPRSNAAMRASAGPRTSSGTPSMVCSAARSAARSCARVDPSSCASRSSSATRSWFSRRAFSCSRRPSSHCSTAATRVTRSSGASPPHADRRWSTACHDSSSVRAPSSFSAPHSDSRRCTTCAASSMARAATARSSCARSRAANLVAPLQCQRPSSRRCTHASASSSLPRARSRSSCSPSSSAATGSSAARSSCHAGLSGSRETSSRSVSNRCHADASESTSRRMSASRLRRGAVNAIASSISESESGDAHSGRGSLLRSQSVFHWRISSVSNAAARSNTDGSASASAHASSRSPSRAYCTARATRRRSATDSSETRCARSRTCASSRSRPETTARTDSKSSCLTDMVTSVRS